MLRLAVLFEGGLLVLALGLGALVGTPAFARFEWRWLALAWGVIATLPPLLGLWWGVRSSWPAARRLVEELERALHAMMAELAPRDLAIISLLAGVAEEALFRGVVQEALAGPVGRGGALAIASALFAAVHAVTVLYAVFAGLIGLYFGWLFWRFDNLLVPIVVHALYDFIALVYFIRLRAPPRPTPANE